MRERKFIVGLDSQDHLKLKAGYVLFHKDLIDVKSFPENHDIRPIGGGFWTVKDGEIYLYGNSSDFGRPQRLEEALKVDGDHLKRQITMAERRIQGEDEKAQREKILAQKEADVAERLAAVADREKAMADLEAKVEAFPKKLEEATEAGKAAGKAEADKSHAFEKRAMEKSAEYEKNLLQAKVDAQTTLIASQDAKIKELETKLDAAYTRNQELATTVAKNSGSTTIVQSSDADNRGKK